MRRRAKGAESAPVGRQVTNGGVGTERDRVAPAPDGGGRRSSCGDAAPAQLDMVHRPWLARKARGWPERFGAARRGVARDDGRDGVRALGRHCLSMLLIVLLGLGGLPRSRGWIALSKDGYVITRHLNVEQSNLESGMRVEGDMLANGGINSFFNHTAIDETLRQAKLDGADQFALDKLTKELSGCVVERAGAVRWSESGNLEGCAFNEQTSTGEWKSLKACDRECGFTTPPLPMIRPSRSALEHSRDGAIECSDTECQTACAIKVNSPEALAAAGFGDSTVTVDMCFGLYEQYVAANPDLPAICDFNLTAASVMTNAFTLPGFGVGNAESLSGATLFQELYPGAGGDNIQLFWTGSEPTDLSTRLTLCIATSYQNCTAYTDKQSVCANKKVDFFPFSKSPSIQNAASIYRLDLDVLEIPDDVEIRTVSGLRGSLCTISYDSLGQVAEIWSLGKILNWSPDNPNRLRLWKASEPTDLNWKKNLLEKEIGRLMPAMQKVVSVWDDPGAEIQGIVPKKPFTEYEINRTCEDYNYSSPAFDHLRVFYNESDWERLFPQQEGESGVIRGNISLCQFPKGEEAKLEPEEQVLDPPWIMYNRLKYDWTKAGGAVSSGHENGTSVPYQPTHFNGTNYPLSCTFRLQAPIGFTTRITIRYVGLGSNDNFTIVSGKEFPDDSKYCGKGKCEGGPEFNWGDVLFNFSGPSGGGAWAPESNRTTFIQKTFSTPVSIKLKTSNETTGDGFLVVYDFIPRIEVLRKQARSTQLGYALALLEMQGADLSSNQWDGQTGQSVGDQPPGKAVLGTMTDAETCYVCCGVRESLEVSRHLDAERHENASLDGASVPPAFQIKPYATGLGSSSHLARNFESTVSLADIPPLVSYMGYKDHHFVRTNFISYLPPGSIKAPYGKPLGKRVDYDVTGIADPSLNPEPKIRDEIGWGMIPILIEQGGNFTDRSNHGWGEGWGNGQSPGRGTHWRNGDGASDVWFPAWQLLARGYLNGHLDLKRFDFDLDHPDVPLFSFVDETRRIVLANEMALALPCGSLINNTCGTSCQVLGTGLNKLQCITNQKKTRCNQPVVDDCNNECGLQGTNSCPESMTAMGAVRIFSLVEDDLTSSFQMTVGDPRRAVKDNLTRSEDITGLGVDGVAPQTGWSHASTSESSTDEVDNALYFSFNDAANSKEVTFDIFGESVTLSLTKAEFRVMLTQEISLEIPIECDVEIDGRDACKLASPKDDVLTENTWYNESKLVSWDTDMDKRMDENELRKVIEENLVFFSIAYYKGLKSCRPGAPGPLTGPVRCTGDEVLRSARELIVRYGRNRDNGQNPDKKGLQCDYYYDCRMAIDDIQRFLADFEAFRRQFKSTLFSLPKFHMAKIQRMGSQGGIEIASPDPTLENEYDHNTNTLRVSAYFKTTGEYTRLGASRYLNRSKTIYTPLVPCLFNVTGKAQYPYGDGVYLLESGWIKQVDYLLETCPAQVQDLCYDGGICNITFTEWFVQLDTKAMSHIFIDGVIEKETPMVFRPSDREDEGKDVFYSTSLKIETKRREVFGRPLIEIPYVDVLENSEYRNIQTAAGERSINLPDASGMVVTTGNLAAIKRLPGLRRRSSFTPYRNYSANVLRLDDSREILGGSYDYKSSQGQADSDCGRFADGSPILCNPLKTVYDVLEDTASQNDDILKFTGDLRLQGTSLTSVVPDSMTYQRLDCSSYRESCETDKQLNATEFLRLIPKQIKVCYENLGVKPCRCEKSMSEFQKSRCHKTMPEPQTSFKDCEKCKAAGYINCGLHSVFGGIQETPAINEGKSMGWHDLESFRKLQSQQTFEDGSVSFLPEYEDWVFEFDNKPAPERCYANISRNSSNYLFLHIYYGTKEGQQAWEQMGKELNATRDGRALPEHTAIQFAALKYLHMQGIGAIEYYEPSAAQQTGCLDLDLIWEGESRDNTHLDGFQLPDLDLSLMPIFQDGSNTRYGLGVSDLERCVACCDLFRVEPAETSEEPPCPYVNVSGFHDAEAVEGLYELTESRSFGARVWKQTPGEYYLHFLPLSCTTRPQCGTNIRDVVRHAGPAWVIGRELGSESVVARAKLDVIVTAPNGTVRTTAELGRRRREAAQHPTVPFLEWFEYSAVEERDDVIKLWRRAQGRSKETGDGLKLICLNVPMWQFATTTIDFEDATEYSKLVVPDTSGHLISTGNLQKITALGTQISPILGNTLNDSYTEKATTRIKTGVGWQVVNITEGNNNVDLRMSTRNISYCPMPRSACMYAAHQQTGLFSCDATKAFESISSASLEYCVTERGYPVSGENYGVESVIMSYADDASRDCVAMFEIDEHYDGTGTFRKLNGKECAPGNTVILVKDDMECSTSVPDDWRPMGTPIDYPYDDCKAVWGSPDIPGVVIPRQVWNLQQILCPTFDISNPGLDEDCMDRLRDGCKQACLRERDCVAAQPFLEDRSDAPLGQTRTPNVRCHLIMNECEQVDSPPGAPYETWIRTSGQKFGTAGGWSKTRWSNKYPLNLKIGENVVLSDFPEHSWVVEDRKEQAVQITWNLTSNRHYKICPSGFSSSEVIQLSSLPEDFLKNHGSPPAIVLDPLFASPTLNGSQITLSDPLNLTSASFPVEITLQGSSILSLADIFGIEPVSRRVRIGRDSFRVASVSAFHSSRIEIEPIYISDFDTVHLPGSVVTPIWGGGYANISHAPLTIKVPGGIYSLENITSKLNLEIADSIANRQFAVSLNIVEPSAGLCGEKIHGASRNLRSFHCAPASRYIQLSGGLKPDAESIASEDDHIHVLETSNILVKLGIHAPTIAYTFGLPSMRTLPKVVQQHSVLPGAGYVSSGYGIQSGYGFGGQAGWNNYIPPIFADQVLHVTWCHNVWGASFQCPPSGVCDCFAVIATYQRILGATKTQRGHTPVSNVIHVPSSADGIVLSTGNLADVFDHSGHVTGLKINALLEHEKTVAMKIAGRLEFASCNEIFGSKDCSLIDTDPSMMSGESKPDSGDISIILDSTSSVAFHMWEKQVVWVAIHGASDELYWSSKHADSHHVWQLLQNEIHAANKTFSSLQDQVSLDTVKPVCDRYCDALEYVEEHEAVNATSQIAEVFAMASHLVGFAFHESAYDVFCEAVQCCDRTQASSGGGLEGCQGEDFSVVQHGNSTLTKCDDSCTDNAKTCQCTKSVRAVQACSIPHVIDLSGQASEMNLWQQTIQNSGDRGQKVIESIEGYRKCAANLVLTYELECHQEEAQCKLPEARIPTMADFEELGMKCCSVLYALGYTGNKPVGDLGSVVAHLDSQKHHTLVQFEQARERCACVEIEGASPLLSHDQMQTCHADQTAISEEWLIIMGGGSRYQIPSQVCVADAGSNLSIALGHNGSESRTIWHFEPPKTNALQSSGPDYLTIPHTDGVLVTTGNLDAITKEAGSLTSLHVSGVTEIDDVIYVGIEGRPAQSRGSRRGQPGAVRTAVDKIPNVPEDAKRFCQGTDVSETDGDCVKPEHNLILDRNSISLESSSSAKSNISFTTLQGERSILFPTWDHELCTGHSSSHCNFKVVGDVAAEFRGRIITTGNLGDIEELSPWTIDTSGHVTMNGPVELGSGYDCKLDGKERRSILTKAHLQAYPYAVWSAFIGAKCAEMQDDIDWTAASGLNWTDVGSSPPTNGRRFRNFFLESALVSKTVFTEAEWESFKVSPAQLNDDRLREDHYIKSGFKYFSPQLVAWKEELSDCKARCEEDRACGAVVQKKGVDRSPSATDARCILLQTLASECTVKPNPGQDVHLLIREAPSPWFSHEANETFFDSICTNIRSNLTHVPGTPIRFRNFLGGDIVYRESDSYDWAEYLHYSCDSFQGFKLIAAEAMEVSKEVEFFRQHFPGSQVVTYVEWLQVLRDNQGWNPVQINRFREKIRDLTGSIGSNLDVNDFQLVYQSVRVQFDDTPELIVDVAHLQNVTSKSLLLTGFNTSECLYSCENVPWCSSVTISSSNRTCALAQALQPRAVLSTKETRYGLCKRVPSQEVHLYEFKEDEQTMLTFDAPTDTRAIKFADASGVVITTGNLFDVVGKIGLMGNEIFSSTSGPRDTGMIHSDPTCVDGYRPNSGSDPRRLLSGDIPSGIACKSTLSGKESNMIVRGCELLTGCMVYSSVEISDAMAAQKFEEHVPKKDGSFFVDQNIGALGVRGSGSGFDYFETFIDVSLPGTRTKGECTGACKGNFPCQRGTFMCHTGCAGYMWPRPGIDEFEECAPMIRGASCGCANGSPYGLHGTSVCIMPNKSHTNYGRYCKNTTQAGAQYLIAPPPSTEEGAEYPIFDCCPNADDLENCGKCVAFSPVVPIGLSQRLTLPEANGTIITTGNVDDLHLDKVKLEGLFLTTFMNFGNQYPGGQAFTPTSGSKQSDGYRYNSFYDLWAAHVEFDPVSTRITGKLNMVAGYGHPNVTYVDVRPGADLNARAGGTVDANLYSILHIQSPTKYEDTESLESMPEYQKRYCIESEPYPFEDGRSYEQEVQRSSPDRCRWKREILLPDVNGTILTYGNLEDTPSIAIPREDLILSSSKSKLTVRGNITFGRRVNYSHDPFNHHYNHELAEIAFVQQQFQSGAQMISHINGDIGLTFQTAGDEIPHITFAHTNGEQGTVEGVNHPNKIENYGTASGPTPFGGYSPTMEISRFTEEGRAGDDRTELWSDDRVKLNVPLGNGVDVALRNFLRHGAPSLPVTVHNHMSAAVNHDEIRDNFGYRSGRPVLQMRSMTYPSDLDSYNEASEPVSPALKGSHAINESWCYSRVHGLGLVDAGLTSNHEVTMSTFSRYLMTLGLIQRTQMNGRFFGSPAFKDSSSDVSGNRVDNQQCRRFVQESLDKLKGTYNFVVEDQSALTIQQSVWDSAIADYVIQQNVHERFKVEFYQNKSDLEDFDSIDICQQIDYKSTYQAIRILSFGIGCKEHDGSDYLSDVKSVQECFEKCLTFDDGICSGFALRTAQYHVDLGLAGTCRFVRRRDNEECTLTFDKQSISGSNYTAYNTTVIQTKVNPISRNCQNDADNDYSARSFDSFRNQYGITAGAGLESVVAVNEVEECYVCCVLNTSTTELVQRAFDNDPSTFHSYHAPIGAVVALDLVDATIITRLRFYPRPKYEASMIGGRFQGSVVGEAEGYEDLHVVKDLPAANEYTLVELSEPKPFRWLRYVGPNGTYADVSEIEFHRGYVAQELTNLQSGNASWNVDIEALTQEENVQNAMLVKCAAHGMLPAMLTTGQQEITLPHTNGIVLTTGNLEDIRMDTSFFSSLNIADNLVMHGPVKLGDPEVDTLLEVNAAVYGLAFHGPLVGSDSFLSIKQSPNMIDATFSLPDYSGTLVVGDLPSVVNSMDVLASGGIDFDSVHLGDRVNLGGAQGNASLEIFATLGESFPLSFGGTFASDSTVSIGTPQVSKDSIVTLPDTSGTILTTGNIPKSMGNISAIDRTILQGGVTFQDSDVEIGEPGTNIGLHLNANIVGLSSLTFDGSTRKDGRTLVLSAADPEGNNEVTMPDASGVVITTANFPTFFDSLRVLGGFEVFGDFAADADSIKIGSLERLSQMAIKAHLAGRFPLAFDGGIPQKSGSTTRRTTTLQVPQTSRHNIITFPDVSGTLVTSTTLPTRIATTDNYIINAARLLIPSSRINLGLSSRVSRFHGSFHFADSKAEEQGNQPERDNQFMVHAMGGVSFVTGQTAKGKNTGAFLLPGSSAWYYVSDEEAKASLQEINVSAIVEGIREMPVYRWRYTGEQASSFQLGPMAQDMWKAFAVGENSDRISASDADGVAFSAIQGVFQQISRLNSTAASYKQLLTKQRATITEQRSKIAKQAALLQEISARIQGLSTFLAQKRPESPRLVL